MSRYRSKAFTLIELLVVIAIVGILIAMLMPAMGKVWGAVRLAQCCSNLNYLGKAYGVRAADELSATQDKLDPRWWSAALTPYLENKGACLICPEDDSQPTPTSSDGSGGSGGSGGDGGGSSTTRPSVSQLFQFMTVQQWAGGQTWYDPFEENTFNIKWSDSQEQAARAKGYLTEAADNLRSLTDTAYHVDGNPNVYWLNHEDHGNDWDFKDIMVKVVIQGDGTVTLTASAGSTGHHNYVVDKDGKVVIDCPSMAQGVTYSVRVPGLGGSGDTNYGMNINATGTSDPNGKLLLMDYSRYNLYGDDLWTDPDLDPNHTGLPKFARHGGMINVLGTDGSVTLRDPLDLNPASTSTRIKYWDF